MQTAFKTTMSVYLVSTLALLSSGAIVTLAMARYRPAIARPIAAVVTLISLAIWLLAGRELPMTFGIAETLSSSPLMNWTVFVDQKGWDLSFYTLILVSGILMVLSIQNERIVKSDFGKIYYGALPASILLLTGTTLISIWVISLAGFVTAWALLALAWLITNVLMRNGGERVEALSLRFGAMLAGGILLWMAAADTSVVQGSRIDEVIWSDRSRIWLALAAGIQLGAFPLHWWRPLNQAVPALSGSLIHILPSIAGAALLMRLADAGSSSTGQLVILTVFGLLGLLAGASLALARIRRPVWAIAALTLAQVGMISMTSAWAGADAVLAVTRVLILGIGGLYIVAGWPGERPKWLVAIGLIYVAGIAGLPLTAGFNGLAPLYDAWFTDGRIIVAILVILLMMLVIAAAVAIAWSKLNERRRRQLSRSNQAQSAIALSLMMLGLVAVPHQPLSEYLIFTWVAIIVATASGFVVSRSTGQVHDIEEALRAAFHLNLPIGRLRSALSRFFSSAGVVVRETASILEGEGGMLWLLVLMIVFWLARRG